MTIPAHDFTRPAPAAPDLRARLGQWLSRSNALLAEIMVGMSAPVSLKFNQLSTMVASESLAQWTDKSLALQVKLSEQEASSLIALPNPLVLELVSRLIGDKPTALQAERELTAAEFSIAQFLVETIVKSLLDSWQGDSAVDLTVGDAEPNIRRSRLFRPTETLFVCRSTATTSLGESHWTWLMTHEFINRMFGLSHKQTAGEVRPSRYHLDRLVRGMRTEIEVRLGGVQLTGPQLAQLQVGDVVVLDQRVGDPLQASISGEAKFLGWAGRVGNRQAFEIESAVQRGFGADVPDVA